MSGKSQKEPLLRAGDDGLTIKSTKGSGGGSVNRDGSVTPSGVSSKVTSGDKEAEEEFVKACGPTGLSKSLAEQRLEEFGPNELSEKIRNPILIFLSYFWGPMPIMIWIAALVEVVKAATLGEGWLDFGVLMVLQFANAIVGYTEESNAGDAVRALKNQLKPKAHVCRDGEWLTRDASELVPGDLIEIKLGDVIPADSILLPGMTVQCDQSALTGESLPTTVYPGNKLMMGSAVKRGESKAVVVQTGAATFLGKAAALLSGVEHQGRFQKILYQITLSLLIICLVFSAIIFGKLQLAHPENWIRNISVVVVILVASIPIAIEVVCTSTLAVGSRRLSEKKIIVARLSASGACGHDHSLQRQDGHPHAEQAQPARARDH